MSKTKLAFSQEWQTIDGVLCVVFIGRDSLRREARVAVPAAAIVSAIASDARRRIAASEKTDTPVTTPGRWSQVRFLGAQSMQVGVTDEKQVGLILDPGLDTEFALSISPDTARELGRHLIEQADKAVASTPGTS
jgi:hypothetical protein